MLDAGSVARYHQEGCLFPLRAFSTERAAAHRAEAECSCADTPGPAAALSESS